MYTVYYTYLVVTHIVEYNKSTRPQYTNKYLPLQLCRLRSGLAKGMFASIAREVNNSRAVTIFFLTAGHHQANALGIAPSVVPDSCTC